MKRVREGGREEEKEGERGREVGGEESLAASQGCTESIDYLETTVAV